MGGTMAEWLVVRTLITDTEGLGFETQLDHWIFQKLSLFTQQ